MVLLSLFLLLFEKKIEKGTPKKTQNNKSTHVTGYRHI